MENIKKILGYRSNLIVYVCILFIFTLVLFQMPLAGQLGYEYSLFTALFISFLLPFYLICFAENNDGFNKNKNEVFKSILLLVIIPLLLGIVKSFIVFPCSVKDGILFYLLFVIPNTAVSVSVSVIVFRLVKKYRRLLSFVILAAIAFLPLIEVYFYPQVYFYNPLIGYYPGTIYDEGIPIDWLLVSYRLIILVYFSVIAILPLYDFEKKERDFLSKVAYAAFIIIPAAVFYIYSPILGYSSDKNRITGILQQKIETKHFDIYMPRNVDAAEMKIIEIEHEYYFEELKEFFKAAPERKITSYVFADIDQKRELMGAGRADVAKPWLNEIYTELGSREQTLKHEIAHIFTAPFGATIFKVANNFNPALIEGIAMAAEDDFDDLPILDVVANAYKCGFKVNLDKLFNGGFSFFTNASNLSYAFAGSFVQYLVDNNGIEKFKTLYTTGDFNAVYGKSFSALKEEYLVKLNKNESDSNIHQAYYYFGGRSIFSKVCPRYVASESERGWEFYNNKQYDRALQVFTRLEELTSNYSSVMGISACMLKINRWNECADLIGKKLNSFKNTNYYYNLQLKLADFLYLSGKVSQADSLYTELINNKPHIRLVKTAGLRRELIQQNRLEGYLTGSEIQRYIILKRLLINGKTDAALPAFLDISRNLKISPAATTRFVFSLKGVEGTFSQNQPQLSGYTYYSLAKYLYLNLYFREAYTYGIFTNLHNKLVWISNDFSFPRE